MKSGIINPNCRPMNKRRLAQLISNLFGPFSVLPFILVVVPLMGANLSSSQLMILGPAFFLTLLVYPLSLFLYYLLSGRISDLDASVREEREGLYSWVVIGPSLAVIFSWLWGNYELTVLMLLFTVTWILVTLFTYVEKVSVHMAVNTAAFFVLNHFWAWRWWWVFLFLPAIAWSRWYLKRHSVHQLILGTLIPVVVFLTGMTLLL